MTKLSEKAPEVERLRAEVERLRTRIHEAVDECQRRYAAKEKELARLQDLMRCATAEAQRDGIKYISQMEMARLALAIERAEKAEAQVERYREAIEIALRYNFSVADMKKVLSEIHD